MKISKKIQVFYCDDWYSRFGLTIAITGFPCILFSNGWHLTHLYLPFHGDGEEDNEVHDEDGPEDRDVEELEEGAAEADERRFRRRVPKLELWQPSDEGAELFVLPRRQRQPVVCWKFSHLSFPKRDLCFANLPSSASSSAIAGSILGVRKASRRFRW